MKIAYVLFLGLMFRFTCACIVGWVYLEFEGAVFGRFMSHLSMLGNLLPYNLGVFMIYEVPVWVLLV